MVNPLTIDGLGGITKGFNRIEHHDQLAQAYEQRLRETAAAGFERLICFSGNRNGLDDAQELNYPRIMRAIVATGYKGYVAQEFLPKRPDPLDSLRQAVKICDV